MYFFGWVSTVLIFGLLADKFGRYWIVLLSFAVSTGIVIVEMLSTSLTLTIAMQFLFGALSSGRTTVCFVYTYEWMTKKWKLIYGTSFIFINGSIALVISLYFLIISDHYMPIVSPAVIGEALTSVGMLFLLAESPLWQLKMG